MITLLATWTFGVTLALVALGVFVSYRLFAFPDITTDGSFTLGAGTTTDLLVAGHDPALATLGGAAAGAGPGQGARCLQGAASGPVLDIVTGEPFKQSAELTGEPIKMKA